MDVASITVRYPFFLLPIPDKKEHWALIVKNVTMRTINGRIKNK